MYGRRRFTRRRPRRRITDSVFHVPSSMNNSIATNSQLLVLSAIPSIVAGAAATTNIDLQDRDRTVTVGQNVGTTTFDIEISEVAAQGILSYVVFKLERKLATPAIGVDTVPSNAACLTSGIQQNWRILNPGRIMKHGMIALTAQTTRSHKVVVNWNKFKKGKMRAGDFYGIALFNRSDGANEVSIEMRYKAYS